MVTVKDSRKAGALCTPNGRKDPSQSRASVRGDARRVLPTLIEEFSRTVPATRLDLRALAGGSGSLLMYEVKVRADGPALLSANETERSYSFMSPSALGRMPLLRHLVACQSRTRNGSFSSLSSCSGTADSFCKTDDSFSRPGTTRTSKTRPVGKSLNLICLLPENSKMSIFGCLIILKVASSSAPRRSNSC